MDVDTVYRRICLQMFFKIGVLKNLANFAGRHLCLSFNKVAGLKKVAFL